MDFKSLWQAYVNTVIRLAPKPPMPAAVGIDIGTSTIKVVELARQSSGFELRNFKVVSFNPDTIADSLKKILDGLSLTNQTLVSAVSGKGTLIRYIDVPRMSNDELRKALAFDLDKYFPFDPTTIFYDCHILQEALQDKKMAALVTAVKRDLVEDKIKVFKQSGYELDRITTNAIATANAFAVLVNKKDEAEHNAKALLDIGGSLSNLMIVQDGTPRFTRDIFIGAHDLTKQIANVFAVDAKQAETMKYQREKSAELLKACEDTIVNLVGEVRVSLDYFMTERNVNVDELFLVGGGAQMEGMAGLFEKHLSIPVQLWQPLTGLKLSSAVEQTDVYNYSSQLTVALGLGLSAL